MMILQTMKSKFFNDPDQFVLKITSAYSRFISMLYKISIFRNPFPGTIINQPNGKNVYAGVAKDYTKEVGLLSRSSMHS